MKYRYIVVGYNYEYYKYVYRQLNDISETVYVNCWPKSQYLRFFYSYYIAHKFPFVKIWTLLFVCFLGPSKSKLTNLVSNNEDNPPLLCGFCCAAPFSLTSSKTSSFALLLFWF